MVTSSLRWLLVPISALQLATGCASSDADPQEPAPFVCAPVSPLPEDAFAVDRNPQSQDVALAKSIANRWLEEHEPESLPWDWGEATLMLSLVDLYRVTGDTTYRDYYRRWIDYHLDKGYVVNMSDRCPPALSALALYQETCEPPYRRVIDDVLHYLYDEAKRTEQGGISHMGTTVFPATLWLDSLFMFGNVFTRWGEVTGDDRALAELSAQYGIFIALLQESPGFFKHAYNFGEQDPDVYWARGNAWVTAAGYEYLRVRSARGESDPAVRDSLNRQVDAVVAAQDPASGLWWTIVNRPGEIYLETSASALFALGLARGYRAGLLDDTVLPTVELAVAGVKSRVVQDPQGRPIVTDISGPTTVGKLSDYAKVELGDDISYGVGAVILMLVEVSGL